MNFELKRDETTGRVPYLYRNDGKHPVTGTTSYETAMWQMQQGKAHVSKAYEGYPLTSDDMYFFAGEGTTSSVSTQGVEPPSPEPQASPAGEGLKSDGESVELGADGLPLPAGDGTKKGRKKRIKDVVCE